MISESGTWFKLGKPDVKVAWVPYEKKYPAKESKGGLLIEGEYCVFRIEPVPKIWFDELKNRPENPRLVLAAISSKWNPIYSHYKQYVKGFVRICEYLATVSTLSISRIFTSGTRLLGAYEKSYENNSVLEGERRASILGAIAGIIAGEIGGRFEWSVFRDWLNSEFSFSKSGFSTDKCQVEKRVKNIPVKIAWNDSQSDWNTLPVTRRQEK